MNTLAAWCTAGASFGRLLVLAGLLACAGHGIAADGVTAALPTTVEQPRAYGHVIGDLLRQRVSLQHAGRELQPATLPPADRVGLWLERRPPRTEADAEGRRWLVIDYQVINAPRSLIAATLPALTLATTTPGVSLAVPAWPLSIGPLTPADPVSGDGTQPTATALPALQPDRTVMPLPTRAIERQLQAALAALAGVLVAWLAWWGWRQWRETQHLPFASAWPVLRRHGAAEPAAWLALHQAINRAAGRVVHAATLPRWLEEAPQWQPLQAELARFFQASNARFFGDADGHAGAASDFPLRDLGRALRAVEKRQQR